MLVTYKQLLQEVVPRPISSDREYKRALKQIERLMTAAHQTRAEADMIELLGTLIEQYEVRQGYTDPVLLPRDRLAGLMEASELTQTDMSVRAQVPRSTLNEILCGKRGIRKNIAFRLATFFGISINELMVADPVEA